MGMGIGGMGMYIQSPTNGTAVKNFDSLPVPGLLNLDQPDLVLLALKTLSSMTLPTTLTLRLVEHSVLPYITASYPKIRMEAATTSVEMLRTIPLKLRGPTSLAVEEIISCIIEVCVTDPDSNVRLVVLKSLVLNFDQFLCRERRLETLLYLLSDESFEIRLESLKILGRLSNLNPAAVLPPLRLLLMRLIGELKTSSDVRLKEDCSLLVCMFAKCTPLLHVVVKPFASTLLATLPLHEGDVRLTTAALEAIGELCVVLREDTLFFVDSLIPIIIANMHDPTSLRKQEMAVKTLGQLVSATGLTIKPYLQYPQMLPWILDLLSKNYTTSPWSLRMEVLRCVGLLGALEPIKYNLILSHLQNTEKEQIERGSDEFNVKNVENSNEVSGGPQGKERSDSRSDSIGSGENISSNKVHSEMINASASNVIRAEVLLDDFNDDTPASLFMYEQSVMKSVSEPTVQQVERKLPSSEDYYPHVAITELMKILRDNSLQIHHSSVTKTIMLIFESLGMRCVPFLDQIIPFLLQLVRTSGPGLRESLLQQFSRLVKIVKFHIMPYLGSLIEIIHDNWKDHLKYVLALLEEIANTASEAFSNNVRTILPLLLSSLTVPKGLNSSHLKSNPTLLKPLELTLNCINSLQYSLKAHIDIIIPALCKLLGQLQEVGGDSVVWQAATVKSIRIISAGSRGGLIEQMHMVVSKVVHSLVRTININYQYNVPATSPVYTECINCIVTIGSKLGPRFSTFDAHILKSIVGKGIDISAYKKLSLDITNGNLPAYGYNDVDFLPYPSGSNQDNGALANVVTREDESDLLYVQGSFSLNESSGGVGLPRSLPLNQQQLARAWDVSQRSTANDWNEWLRRLRVDLLRESPSPSLRACAALAQAYSPLARELFHAAFISCWTELNEQYQDSLVRALKTAFKSNTIPPEILQALLNLAEFMEHDVEALPIPLSILADLAQKGHAYAKALHYRELEFHSNPVGCFESLVNINKKLDQYDAAVGVLKSVSQMQKKYPQLQEAYRVQEAWLAKLGNWNEALIRYDQRLEINPKDSLAISGKLKCLDALGRWEEAIQLCNDNLDHLRIDSVAKGNSNHTKAAVLGGRAAWYLNQWNLMDQFISQLSNDNVEGSFMKAVLAVHHGKYDESARLIEHTRKQLDLGITALLAESYGRAYVPLITAQQCSELEEITEYLILLRELGFERNGTSENDILLNMSRRQERPDQRDEDNLVLSPRSSFSKSPVYGLEPSSLSSRDSSFTAGMPYHHTKAGRGNEVHFVSGPTSTSDMSCIPKYSPYSNEHSARFTISAAIESTGAKGKMSIGTFTSTGDDDADNFTNSDSFQQALSRKKLLAAKWRKRIKGCASTGRAAISVWKTLLNGRKMILSEREDLDTWLEFASLSRDGGNNELAYRVLTLIKNCAMTPSLESFMADKETNLRHNSIVEKRIDFAILEQRWATGEKMESLKGLEALTRSFTEKNIEETCIHVSCILKLGEWKLAMIGPGNVVDKNTRKEILMLYNKATSVDPKSYQAWHQWGLANYRAIEELRIDNASNSKGTSTANSLGLGYKLGLHSPRVSLNNSSLGLPKQHTIPKDVLVPLATNAIKGLLKALSLGTRRNTASVMQDMLCILSVWFRYSSINEVCSTVEQGLATVHLDNFLGVLPQLIARIDHQEPSGKKLLHDMLSKLGTRHCQALVYPLSVALKSPIGERKEAAEMLMKSLRQHSAKLIDQALLVSQELVRVAMLWQEVWHESLEEASRQYFGDGNIQAMLETLAPLHEVLANGPNTLREASFCNAYGHDLYDAWEFLKNYNKIMTEKGQAIPTSGAAPSRKNRGQQLGVEETCLHQAWDLYYAVFKRINVQLPQVTSLELQYCSPNLFNSRDLDLGVPGTYTVNGTAVRIRNFGPTIAIIRSKQRPRKIKICGDDGHDFVFLLKGHEDLRQDERAMQLFGLVNALLRHERRTGRETYDLSIQRYAVIPLSPTAGLISWVPNCDTFHDLIRDFRDSKKIMLNDEHKRMQHIAPNTLYDSLPMINKLEVFAYALTNTNGEDLAKILWLKSETSEAWLQRRATYTRSMAVMSMVGYVLGLGDRHPSNLMLDRKTGKVLHIDFGDCFEVAMHREKYPERVPFRLTRMTVNAMEVSGIEGSYRFTCEEVMSVLRENKDSLVATLEAFVHDPLISWRLFYSNKVKVRKNPADSKSTAVVKSGNPSPKVNMENIAQDSTPTKSGNPSPKINVEAEIFRSRNPSPKINLVQEVMVDSGIKGTATEETEIIISVEENQEKRKLLRRKPSLETVSEGELDSSVCADAAATQAPLAGLVTTAAAGVGTAVTPPLLGLNRPTKSPPGITASTTSLVRTDLHLEMSSLAAASTSMATDRRTSFSVTHHSVRALSIAQASVMGDLFLQQGELTEKAVTVIKRVMDKLTGFDFNDPKAPKQVALDIPEQVDRLIKEATANENLSLSFAGWCPWW
jgi:phosphatidylinositol kinase/protein kinase (PI-3  family)